MVHLKGIMPRNEKVTQFNFCLDVLDVSHLLATFIFVVAWLSSLNILTKIWKLDSSLLMGVYMLNDIYV